ncbi:MAG: RNA polymerase sigma factor [Ignavibacteriae bacterium]|nr:RNA polymerase sigma factor [Ignavibacteriota bacterium]
MKTETDKIIQFTLLYNRYKKRLYNFLLKLSGDRMTAEDITQSTFLKLYENFESLQNKGSVNYWIFRTARNEYYNYYKREKRKSDINENLISTKQDEFELESYIELKEMKKIVLSELDKMEIEQKEVYLLKEYGGLSYKEISETLEIEVNLVKSRLYKVRQKLINRISKLV